MNSKFGTVLYAGNFKMKKINRGKHTLVELNTFQN